MVAKKVKYAALCLFLLCFGAAIIIYPERYVNCCLEGFVLWAECVLPALFPFIIISLIIIKTGIADRASLPLRRVTGALNLPQSAAICFLLSVFSGYPAGSRLVAEFYEGGALTCEDCDRIAPLCSTSGPLFIIGSVGYKFFGDKTLGLKIFLAHALAVVIVSLIYCRLRKKGASLPPERVAASGNILYDAFYGGVISVAVAGGFIAFFFVVAQFLQDFNILLPLERLLNFFLDENSAKAVCLGLAEVTTGCGKLAACNTPLKGPLAGFMITFGGISIIMQQLGYLTKTGIKPLKFIAFKAVQAALCFLIMLALQ